MVVGNGVYEGTLSPSEKLEAENVAAAEILAAQYDFPLVIDQSFFFRSAS